MTRAGLQPRRTPSWRCSSSGARFGARPVGSSFWRAWFWKGLILKGL